MVPRFTFESTNDPIDEFYEVLEYAWRAICDVYDLTTDLPELSCLFRGVDLDTPEQAAQTVVINMLTEVIDSVGRFSPFYTLPARSFGLTTVYDRAANRTRWTLAPEAAQNWHKILMPLASEIEYKCGLIRFEVMVQEMVKECPEQEEWALAQCQCIPPRVIHLKPSILEQTEIVCDLCKELYYQIEEDDL
jgi:hypothetical protein